QLTARGIANVRTASYSLAAFQPSPKMDAALKKLNVVMTGEIPIALVNGMGKANPTLEDVVSEFNKTSAK
ncbi:MAG TPA: hypothetical protein VHE37_06525, partial [Nevskiaceae bacterium]|nr:hypothetical protein [Nevskiaceae bacterium]